jgi:hypothetical protein
MRARSAEHTRSARDRFRGLIEGTDHLPCLRHAMERRPGSWQKRSALANVVDKGGRHADLCRRMKLTVVKAVQQAELSFADAGRVGEHGLEHRAMTRNTSSGAACRSKASLSWRCASESSLSARCLTPAAFECHGPHAFAVYTSKPLSPGVTQHSLPSGRCSLLGPDLHRLDRTSFAWRTHSITSSAMASSVGGTSMPSASAAAQPVDEINSGAGKTLQRDVRLSCRRG